jgi:hypothetical protein
MAECLLSSVCPDFFAETLDTCSKIPHRPGYITRNSCRKRQFLRIGYLCPRWTISHGAVIAAGKAGKATSHRRFVRRAVRGSGQQILSRIASLTDVAAYSIRSMIRHQTRDNALMSSSSSKSINPDGTEVPLWDDAPSFLAGHSIRHRGFPG